MSVTPHANWLRYAETIVNGDRRQDYGHPLENFTQIAELWTAYLEHPITAEQVGMMMILIKIARQSKVHKDDNFIDLIGYAACMQEIHNRLIDEGHPEGIASLRSKPEEMATGDPGYDLFIKWKQERP